MLIHLPQELANKTAKAKAALAPQMAQAELEQAQALPGLTKAQAGQASANHRLTWPTIQMVWRQNQS